MLREAATWRTVKLIGGWIMLFLFVFWLSNFFSLYPLPDNPLKLFLTEKNITNKKNKKNSKWNKSSNRYVNVNYNEKPIPPSICYEELYEFSKWGKFTDGRPRTDVFYQGRTYTYEKLPEFPQNKPRKPKAKKKL